MCINWLVIAGTNFAITCISTFFIKQIFIPNICLLSPKYNLYWTLNSFCYYRITPSVSIYAKHGTIRAYGSTTLINQLIRLSCPYQSGSSKIMWQIPLFSVNSSDRLLCLIHVAFEISVFELLFSAFFAWTRLMILACSHV